MQQLRSMQVKQELVLSLVAADERLHDFAGEASVVTSESISRVLAPLYHPECVRGGRLWRHWIFRKALAHLFYPQKHFSAHIPLSLLKPKTKMVFSVFLYSKLVRILSLVQC